MKALIFSFNSKNYFPSGTWVRCVSELLNLPSSSFSFSFLFLISMSLHVLFLVISSLEMTISTNFWKLSVGWYETEKLLGAISWGGGGGWQTFSFPPGTPSISHNEDLERPPGSGGGEEEESWQNTIGPPSLWFHLQLPTPQPPFSSRPPSFRPEVRRSIAA